jgi:hypothetical protein
VLLESCRTSGSSTTSPNLDATPTAASIGSTSRILAANSRFTRTQDEGIACLTCRTWPQCSLAGDELVAGRHYPRTWDELVIWFSTETSWRQHLTVMRWWDGSFQEWCQDRPTLEPWRGIGGQECRALCHCPGARSRLVEKSSAQSRSIRPRHAGTVTTLARPTVAQGVALNEAPAYNSGTAVIVRAMSLYLRMTTEPTGHSFELSLAPAEPLLRLGEA